MVDGCTKRYTDPSSLRKHLKTTHDFIEPGQYRKYLDAKKALGGEVGILEKELFKREEENNRKRNNQSLNNETSDKMPQISLNTAMTLYNLLQTPPNTKNEENTNNSNDLNTTGVQKLFQVQNNQTLPPPPSLQNFNQNFPQNNQLTNLLRSNNSNLNQPAIPTPVLSSNNHNLLSFQNLTPNGCIFQQNHPQITNNITLDNTDNSNLQNIALALTLLLNQNNNVANPK